MFPAPEAAAHPVPVAPWRSDFFISASLTPVCQAAPAWAGPKELWLEGHKLLSRTGKEIPGEQIGLVLIKGERQGRGAKQHLSNQTMIAPHEDERFEVGLRRLKLSF